MKKILSMLLLILMLACVLAACDSARSITKSEIVNGELVLTYSDGTTENLGKVVGDKGDQGEKGDKGDTGETGAQGPQGEKGDKGDTGAQGVKGDTGATGAQGIQGEKGDKGDQGAQGIQGEKGDKGDTGATGAQGIQGEKGEDGEALVDDNPQGLDFYLLPDGTYAVSAGKAIYLEEITVPATYRGKAVTCVGMPEGTDFDAADEGDASFGFYMLPNLKKITLPDSITYIGECAFRECANLSHVDLPSSLTGIGGRAFYRCSSLASIEIPASVTSIGDYAFANCTSLTSVTFAETSGWTADGYTISATDLADPAKAASYLKSTYCEYYWNRTVG